MVELNHVSRLQQGSVHVVKLLGMSHNDAGALYLVYEFANRGCFDSVPEDCDLRAGVLLLLQCARGLQHMHHANTVHGDIKPHNLLLHQCQDGSVRGLLADLGMAKLIPPGVLGVEKVRGTKGFLAPECRGRPGFASFAGDIFAFGVTMGCLATGAKPEYITVSAQAVHPDANPTSVRAAVTSVEGRIGKEFDMPPTCTVPLVRSLVGLIFDCCKVLPDNRPTAAELVTRLEQVAQSSII